MDINKLIESLSPHELKVLHNLDEKKVEDICKKSNLEKTSVLRALEYLQNKGIVKLNYEKEKIIELGVNGALYRKKGLPERRLMNLLAENRVLEFSEAMNLAKLSDEELKASLGALKNKALVEIKNGKIIFTGHKEEVTRKTLEEIFIDMLPLKYEDISPEQAFALKNLQKRKNIVEIADKQKIEIQVTDIGLKLMKAKIKPEEMIEIVDAELLKSEKNWKGKKFRRYDVESPVPALYGGKRHFVNQASDYARRIWTDMGFKEMEGTMVQGSFWNFDALFTAQDHPVREMQDTFFISKKMNLPDKKIVDAVKKSHESGVGGSRGWGYSWNEEEAKRIIMRTHTTCLSSQTLSKLKESDLPVKFFAIGKCFRNETVDWSHGFEFNQTEGIVIDPNTNFRHLLGYLKQFFTKMGFPKVRFRPAYFPYTEPSVEIDVWHSERKCWLEIGGAGIFRPEVTIPLLGKHIPVLAWGPGFDRIIMDYYEIKDLREMYKNNISQLRKMKMWVK